MIAHALGVPLSCGADYLADAVVDGYLKENVYVSKAIKVDKGKTRIDEFLTADNLTWGMSV